MNRPNKENYKCLLTYTIKADFAVGNYVNDLEAYCNELEKENELLKKKYLASRRLINVLKKKLKEVTNG